MKHSEHIGAFLYRGVMVCGPCVTVGESRLTGQFFGWPHVRESGWTCERCGVELETLAPVAGDAA